MPDYYCPPVLDCDFQSSTEFSQSQNCFGWNIVLKFVSLTYMKSRPSLTRETDVCPLETLLRLIIAMSSLERLSESGNKSSATTMKRNFWQTWVYLYKGFPNVASDDSKLLLRSFAACLETWERVGRVLKRCVLRTRYLSIRSSIFNAVSKGGKVAGLEAKVICHAKACNPWSDQTRKHLHIENACNASKKQYTVKSRATFGSIPSHTGNGLFPL